jgi:CHAT domain-containing protein
MSSIEASQSYFFRQGSISLDREGKGILDGDLTGSQRFTLSLLGVVGLACAPLACRRDGHSTPSVLASYGGIPGCQARFTGGFPPASSAEAPRIPVNLRYRIERAAAKDRSPRALSDQAILRLLHGQVDLTVSILEKAVSRQPAIPSLGNDLAAAYLTRFALEHNPYDLILGLAAVEQALALEPRLPEALYNRALVLDRLFLTATAVQAWRDYLDGAPGSDWSGVARRHLQALKIEPEDVAWKRALDALPADAAGPAIRALVHRFRQRSRLYAEQDLLGRWATALLEGRAPDAADALKRVRVFGTALAELEGDLLLADTVAAIDRAEAAGDRERLLALAQGHGAFRDGMELLRDAQDRRALERFLSAAERLARGGSPFRLWAEFRASYCRLNQGDYDAALAGLARLRQEAGQDRYPNLLGRALTVLGIAHLKLAHFSESLSEYERARAWFEKTGETEHAASVEFMMAENLRYQGETQRAWLHRYKALAATSRLGSSIYFNNTLFDSAEAALKQGLPAVALAFQDEMVAFARRQKDDLLLAQALARRSRAHLLLQDQAGARQDLDEARRVLERIPEEQRRPQLEADLGMAAGEVETASHPETAIRFLSAALAFAERRKDSFHLPGLYYQRAMAALHRGDRSSAEQDLDRSIVEQEHQRKAVLEDQLRVQYSDQGQAAFDEMIRLQASLGHLEQAFDIAERGRTRNLLEILDKREGERIAAGILTARQIRAEVPADVALVEYALLSDQVLAWVLTRNRLDLIPIAIRRPDLEEKIRRFRSRLQGQGTDLETDRLAADLYDLLLRPLRRDLAGVGTLVLVPDRSLHLLPFNLLLDERRGRYLIEDFAVAVAPSANLEVRAARRSRELEKLGKGRTLIVSDPAFEEDQFPTFTRLRGAMAEGRAIAALSRDSELLTGDAATKTALLRDAAEAEVIHLGAHARVNTDYPLLSVLPLAPDAGRIGSGALYAYEIYRIPFRRTRLVVLAACDSGAGALSESEGVASLARPFLAAGVPAVVASLWQVDDRSTAALFQAFHRDLSAGQSPLLALRRAQLALLDSDRKEARRPSSWAAFQLLGGID